MKKSSLMPAVAAIGKLLIEPGRPEIITLVEGSGVTLNGLASAAGTATRTDDTGAVVSTTALGPGVTYFGGYRGTQTIAVTCTAGSIDAVVGDAIFGVAATVKAANSIVPFGDSITANNWAASNVSAGNMVRDPSGSFVTVTLSNHPFMTGQLCLVEQAADGSFNGPWAVTRTGVNTFTIPSAGTPNATTGAAVVRCPYQQADNGWLTFAKILLGNRMAVLYNAGIGGNTTTQMLARIQRDVLLKGAYWVSEMSGINDIASFGATAAQVFANKQAIWSQLIAAGSSVIAHTTLPLEYGYSGLANSVIDGYNESVRQLNAMIRRAASSGTKGIVLCDSYAAVVDPNSTTGQPLAGMMSSDHIHPAPKGCLAVARAFAAVVAPLMPLTNTLPSSAADNRASSAGNANLWRSLPTNTAGGTVSAPVTGTAADQFRVASSGNAGRTCVASVVARTVANDGDAIGYNQQMTCTAAAAGDSFTITQSASGWASTVAVGKAYYLEFSLKVSGVAGSNLRSLLISVTYVVDGVNYNAYILQPTNGTYPTEDFAGVVQTVPFILNGAAATNISINVVATCSGAGSAFNVGVGRVDVMELPVDAQLTY